MTARVVKVSADEPIRRAAELMKEFTPTEETETEVHYQLLKADCDRLQAQLKQAGISYMAEDSIAATTDAALVLLSK